MSVHVEYVYEYRRAHDFVYMHDYGVHVCGDGD